MMHRCHRFLIGFLFACAGCAFVQAETIAVVLKTEGTVLVKRSGSDSDLKAERGFRIEDGDKIITAEKSFAALRFIDDASLVRIRPNSVCVVQGKRERDRIVKNVSLEVGVILTRITQQKGAFQVVTPTSVASVKGTEFITDQDERGPTTYHGREGTTEVSNMAGSVDMGQGETVVVNSENSAPQLRQTQPGEVPLFEAMTEEEFELEFENEAGRTKTLKFKVKKE
jgi:hypothetical protein